MNKTKTVTFREALDGLKPIPGLPVENYNNKKLLEEFKKLDNQFNRLYDVANQMESYITKLNKKPNEFSRRWELTKLILQESNVSSAEEFEKMVKFAFEFSAKGLEDDVLEREKQELQSA